MKLNDWEELSEKRYGESKLRQIERVIRGLEMLASRTDKTYSLSAEHDELFCGGPSPEDESWADDDLLKMAEWGWRWDDDVESWALFT